MRNQSANELNRYGLGRVYLRGRTYWIQYSFRGKQYRESSGSTSDSGARKLLKKRLGEMGKGQLVGPAEERLTVHELCDNLITHLKTKGAKAVPSFESHLKPIREAFALSRAVDLTTARLEQFITERREVGKAAATVNRETGALRQALNLARKQGRLTVVPYVPMLREDNARQGFFERAEFEAVAAKLEEPIADIARFAYLTGWRKGEILPLSWDRIDRAAGEIRLRAQDTKNRQARAIAYDGDAGLADLIERRWRAREFETQDGQTGLSKYVFCWPTGHRNAGQPVRDYSKAWRKACTAAKMPGKLMHDFRRTAARNMIRAGVPETVARSITGHKTRAMFDRYNITSTDDTREALRLTREHRAAQPTERNVEAMLGGSN